MVPNSQLKMIAAVTGGVAQATITPPSTKPDILLPSLRQQSHQRPDDQGQAHRDDGEQDGVLEGLPEERVTEDLGEVLGAHLLGRSPRSWRLPTFWNDMIPIWIIGQNIRIAITSTVGVISR